MAAGRPKKYTKKKLREETERYFRSISRTILARDDTGGIIRNDRVPGNACNRFGIRIERWKAIQRGKLFLPI